MKMKETLQWEKQNSLCVVICQTEKASGKKNGKKIESTKKTKELNEGKPSFVLHDGPPYANGNIHLGHSLNKISKDIIIRSKSMSGYHSYVPGWDTHGLPIEQVLANKGVKRKEMSMAEYLEKCREYALSQVDKQRADFKRLGVAGDWEHPYVTLDPSYEAAQVRVFGKMAEKGYIYKGLKPIYWSPSVSLL